MCFRNKLLVGTSLVTVFGVLVTLNVTDCFANQWSLDKTFGQKGIAVAELDGPASADAISLQPDGKLVVAGSEGDDLRLVRFNVDGTSDRSFIVGQVPTRQYGVAKATALIRLNDGKFVAAGRVGRRILLTGFNADGSVNNSFKHNAASLPDGPACIQALAVQPDGKVVAVGHVGSAMMLLRFHPDGTFDDSFGRNGFVILSHGDRDSRLNAVVVQDDGKIVAAGQVEQNFLFARFNSDGTVDESFGGSNGFVKVSFDNKASAKALITQPDGKYVAAGSAGGPFAVFRLSSDGQPDDSFLNGTIDTGEEIGVLSALSVQPDGKIITAGRLDNKLVLVRLNPDGTPDRSFGVDSRVIVERDNSRMRGNALISLPNGKLVIAGSFNNRLALFRFMSGEPTVHEQYSAAQAEFRRQQQAYGSITDKIQRALLQDLVERKDPNQPMNEEDREVFENDQQLFIITSEFLRYRWNSLETNHRPAFRFPAEQFRNEFTVTTPEANLWFKTIGKHLKRINPNLKTRLNEQWVALEEARNELEEKEQGVETTGA